jgi:CsoR family transcriptional regulator, copper-sensing transcriptional repressor
VWGVLENVVKRNLDFPPEVVIAPTVKRAAYRRINILKGQMTGLWHLIQTGTETIRILNQAHAIRKAINSLEILILEDHLNTNLPDRLAFQKDRTTKELIAIFKRSQ